MCLDNYKLQLGIRISHRRSKIANLHQQPLRLRQRSPQRRRPRLRQPRRIFHIPRSTSTKRRKRKKKKPLFLTLQSMRTRKKLKKRSKKKISTKISTKKSPRRKSMKRKCVSFPLFRFGTHRPTAPAAPEKYISPAAETARIAYRAKEPEVHIHRQFFDYALFQQMSCTLENTPYRHAQLRRFALPENSETNSSKSWHMISAPRSFLCFAWFACLFAERVHEFAGILLRCSSAPVHLRGLPLWRGCAERRRQLHVPWHMVWIREKGHTTFFCLHRPLIWRESPRRPLFRVNLNLCMASNRSLFAFVLGASEKLGIASSIFESA